MRPSKTDESFSEQEAQQRFEKLVHVALKTPPKPQKMMGYKGVPAQRKKRRKQKRVAQSVKAERAVR